MPFVKLDCGILDSSLWIDRAQRDVFITALLMAVPLELEEQAQSVRVRSLEHDEHTIPPGRYGFVAASGGGIVRRALVESEEGLTALEKLCAPDPDSRSEDFEGRRLARIDGGYLVLNYFKYRDFDYNAADRMRRLRERRRDEESETGGKNVRRNGDGVHPNVTHADADAEEEREKSAFALSPSKTSSGKKPAGSKGTRIPDDFTLTPERRKVAESFGLDAMATFEDFSDYWRARPGAAALKADWNATWRTWCRRERKQSSIKGGSDNGLPTLRA
jgi:hypothetical protein